MKKEKTLFSLLYDVNQRREQSDMRLKNNSLVTMTVEMLQFNYLILTELIAIVSSKFIVIIIY